MPLKTLLCAASMLAAALLAAPAHAASLRNRQGGYELQVLVDGSPVRTYQHQGSSFILGQLGARYIVRVWNHSGRRVEADVSVDGRDVLTGKPANFQTQRGYLISAWGYVDIDGWRISKRQAAAFRFSTVPSSYAALTGSAREVGVIGVAVFPERYVPPPQPVYIAPPCGTDGPACYRNGPRDVDEGAASAMGRARASPPPAPAAKGGFDKSKARRSGLATAFGEAVDSNVTEVSFVRQNPLHPSAVLGLHYNDAQGLWAMGVDVNAWRRPTEAQLRQTADPFPEVDPRYAQPPPGWTR